MLRWQLRELSWLIAEASSVQEFLQLLKNTAGQCLLYVNKVNRSIYIHKPFISKALRYSPCVTRGSHSFTCHPHRNYTCLWVASKTVWSPCYTRAISERFRDKGLIIKRYINSPSLLYFTPQLQGVTTYWLVLTAPTHEGMARLSSPGWLVTYQDNCPTLGLNTDMFTRPSTNRDRCKLTSLIKTNALLLCQTTTKGGRWRHSMAWSQWMPQMRPSTISQKSQYLARRLLVQPIDIQSWARVVHPYCSA